MHLDNFFYILCTFGLCHVRKKKRVKKELKASTTFCNEVVVNSTQAYDLSYWRLFCESTQHGKSFVIFKGFIIEFVSIWDLMVHKNPNQFACSLEDLRNSLNANQCVWNPSWIQFLFQDFLLGVTFFLQYQIGFVNQVKNNITGEKLIAK